MRLINILLWLCVALGFAACSKDDTSSWREAGVAKLSISVLCGGIGTKASDVNERSGEANINSLTALVFDETGTQLLGYKWQSTSGSVGNALIEGVEARTVRVKIAIVSNVGDGLLAGVGSVDQLQKALVQLSDQSQGNLTMSSALVATTSALDADGNYIGVDGAQNLDGMNSPLLLTRVPARIDLISLGTNFAGSPLEGRRVRVDEVYVSDVKTTAHCFSVSDWGAVEVGGAGRSLPAVAIGQIVSDGSSINASGASFYVMENTGLSASTTRLVLKATIQATDAFKEETKYFSSVINSGGGGGHIYVKRNFVYGLNVSFSGTSFTNKPIDPKPDPEPGPDPNPDPNPPVIEEAGLDVKVVVANWGVVIQNPEID